MTADEIRNELRQLEIRKTELMGMLVQETLPKSGNNACGAAWRSDGSCGFCGSMPVGEAIRRLDTPGNSFSGADWKYGWPHKFYIGSGYPHKFYNSHLRDATLEEFKAFNDLSEFYFGITWITADNKLTARAAPNTQFHGKTTSRKEAAS